MLLAIAIGCCQYLSAYADGVTTASKVVGTPAGEFSVSPLGAAVYTMAIDVPKGYGKMQPNIALVYNSQSGYGIAGYGVNISGLSAITRGSKDIFHDGAAKGMSHEADDAYYLDGKRLIYQSGNKGQEGAVYVPEGNPYTKVTFHGNYNDSEANTWIEVVTQDGITYQYGRAGNSTIIYTAKGKPRIHAWMINRASDVMGRYINYVYQRANLNCIPLAVSYSYDDKGFPTSTRSNGLVLDSLVSSDGLVSTHLLPYGMTYKKTLGNNLTLKNLNIHKDGQNLFNMDFNYDPISGNLLSRTGMLSEKETFGYDTLDRLVSVNTGNSPSLNISYANNGNIMCKTDVGNYTYSSVKPHAVMKIDNADAYQYTSDMTTEYNDMGRIKLISQRQMYPINVKFAYGVDGSLWNLDYTPSMRSTDIGGHRAWSRYYDDNYEYLQSASYHRDFYYLTDHVMAVRDYDKDFEFYVVAKDNLGSIVGIYDANGAKVFSASYDAWGKQTVSETKDDMNLMLRGYCGHTMLNEFDLIDMKGRLYDPVVGRFLSPDNYVQTPDNSQNFNRYSYCLNNPLKYTDPSGEVFWVPIAIGAAIGAYAGASIQSHNLAFWKWNSNAWQGAIAGAFVGATLGAGVAAATGQSGISYVVDGVTHATKAWSVSTTLINGGTVNMGLHLGNGWDSAWKSALVGTAVAAWSHTGGFGLMNKLKQVHGISGALGRIGYQMTGTLAASIGNNWANNQGLFSKLTLGVGPVNLTLGKGQSLLQLSNNIGNIVGNLAGLVNVGFDFSKIHWDNDNLTFNSVGGIADIKYPGKYDNVGLTIFSILGNHNLSEVYAHELVHLWEERSMYGNYFPNYVVQGLYSLLGGFDFTNSNFKGEGINAYEQEAYLYRYWNF